MNNFIKMNFDMVVAADVGTDAAIIFSNIQFWVAKNKANNKNFHDGKHWTYNSVKAWLELFPYLTESKIRTCLTKLEDKKYIEVANHNKKGYDRTKWFHANDTVICDSYQMQLLKMPNAFDGIIKPIPDNKPDNKPNEHIVQFSFSINSKEWSKEHIEQGFNLFWDKYGLKQSRSLAFTSWKKVCKNGDAEKAYNGIENYNKHLSIEKWKQKKMASTWLNQKTWEDEYNFTAPVEIEEDDFQLNDTQEAVYQNWIEEGKQKYPALVNSKTIYLTRRQLAELMIYANKPTTRIEFTIKDFKIFMQKCFKELNDFKYKRDAYINSYNYIIDEAKKEINR